ncbi:MAG: Nif3-like dinuclear metal center hexameric protein [Candidatus Thorarchaeota archaeon]
MTTLLEILKHLDVISPKDYEIPGKEGYIEVGPSTRKEQSNTTISRVLVTVYPSSKTIAKASQDKANLIISFMPMLAGSTKQIAGLDLVRLRLLTKNYISMYIIGSSWIAAKDGLTDALSDALNLTVTRKFNLRGKEANLIPIGRICRTPSDMNHSGFANYLASKLGISNITFTGTIDDEVEEILLCAGSIIDNETLHRLLQEGIRTVVVGQLNQMDRMIANNLGLNILELGSFVTEAPGMKRLRHQLSLEFPELKIEFSDTDPITQTLRPYTDEMA